jgi:hypothetical protein
MSQVASILSRVSCSHRILKTATSMSAPATDAAASAATPNTAAATPSATNPPAPAPAPAATAPVAASSSADHHAAAAHVKTGGLGDQWANKMRYALLVVVECFFYSSELTVALALSFPRCMCSVFLPAFTCLFGSLCSDRYENNADERAKLGA